ncbi:MAG: WG repeat-containing protein [Clostridia bacterium]|nr:WG repeat-containing protein [Clostridia bacterium]
MKNKKKMLIVSIVSIITILAVVITAIIIFNNSKTRTKKEEEREVFTLIYKDEENYYYADEKEKIYTFTGYKKIGEFKNGLAIASKEIDKERQYAIIDKNEKQIVKFGTYDYIKTTDNDKYYEVKKDSLNGIIDEKGNIIIPLEYDQISTYNNLGIFYVEKDDKYYYLSENGKVICETEEKGFFNNSINYSFRINSSYDYLIKIDNNYYNAKTGDVIFKDREKINFQYNILFENNKVSIYDKNLKLKEELKDQNVLEIKIEKTDTNYIILIETIKKDDNTTYQKYRIYDEELKLKKEVDDINVKYVTYINCREEYFYIVESDGKTSGDKKIRIILFNKDLKEFIREDSTYSSFHINSKNEITVISRDDKANKVYFYNTKGEKVATIENFSYDEKCYKSGDYIALKSRTDKTYSIYKTNGELIATGANYIDELTNKIIKITRRSSNENSVIFENGKEIKLNNYDWNLYGETIIAINLREKKVKTYDKQGNLKNEFSDIIGIDSCNSKYITSNRYVLLKGNGKIISFDTLNNKKVFEFEKDSMAGDYVVRGNYAGSGVYIIELEDGFYNFEGKKLLDKKK